jgi:hypothetical protein
VAEANHTLQAIQHLGQGTSVDAWVDPSILAKAVMLGVLDAPQLKNNPFALGQIKTRIIHGCCEAIDPQGKPISETERLTKLVD